VPDLLWRPESPITHSAAWWTDVQLSRTGFERRRALLDAPRQFVDLSLRLDESAEVRRYRTHLFQDLNAVWRVPLWWEPETTTATILNGQAVLTLDTTYIDMSSGDAVVLVNTRDDTTHVTSIASITPGQVTLDDVVTVDFPPGSQLFKLQDMRLMQPPRLQRIAVGHEVAQIGFEFDAPAVMGGFGATLATFQHDDDAEAYSLLDKKPLEPADYVFDAYVQTIDHGRRFVNETDVDPAAIMERRRYLIETRAELQYWEKFLDTIVGGLKPFYTPTYRNDLVIHTQAGGPNWDTIRVTDESDDVTDAFDYAGQWFPHASYKQLRFETDQGEQYREVTGAADSGTGHVELTLASGLAANTVISDISFLERCRLDADAVRFSHTGLLSTVEISLKVEQRSPDE
jgi:hypothetical protein